MKFQLSASLIAASLVVCTFATLPAAAESAGAPVRGTATDRILSNDQPQRDLLDAEVASQRGIWNESARLAEISYRAKPDLWNEFNLATAYQHTGRSAEAIPLYIDLTERGQFARSYPLYSYDRSWPAPMLPFLADEAAHRLNQMGAPIVPAHTPDPMVAVR